jgi:endonuclease VIII
MPEGDTLRRIARNLERALGGRRITALFSTTPALQTQALRLGLVGAKILACESRGKHLLVHFEGGASLHTHLGMRGSWRVHSQATRPPGLERRARVALETDELLAACLGRTVVVELLPPGGVERHPRLTRLGPDLLSEGFDTKEAAARLGQVGDDEAAVALLRQTVMAGIGNVYKSEVLFLCGVDPFRLVAHLDQPTRERIVGTARRLLQRNLGPGPRRTTSSLSPQALWVYRRAGLPCRRCGTTIRRTLQGADRRSTYWCPRCQAGP